MSEVQCRLDVLVGATSWNCAVVHTVVLTHTASLDGVQAAVLYANAEHTVHGVQPVVPVVPSHAIVRNIDDEQGVHTLHSVGPLQLRHTRSEVAVGGVAWTIGRMHAVVFAHTRSVENVGGTAWYCVALLHTVSGWHAVLAYAVAGPVVNCDAVHGVTIAHCRTDDDVCGTDWYCVNGTHARAPSVSVTGHPVPEQLRVRVSSDGVSAAHAAHGPHWHEQSAGYTLHGDDDASLHVAPLAPFQQVQAVYVHVDSVCVPRPAQ